MHLNGAGDLERFGGDLGLGEGWWGRWGSGVVVWECVLLLTCFFLSVESKKAGEIAHGSAI